MYWYTCYLTYYHKQCIDGIDEIRREAWSLYKYGDWSQGVHLTVKEKIAALRLLKECNDAKFRMYVLTDLTIGNEWFEGSHRSFYTATDCLPLQCFHWSSFFTYFPPHYSNRNQELTHRHNRSYKISWRCVSDWSEGSSKSHAWSNK